MSEPVLCYVSDQFAYFTTKPLSEQWGDDWNDAPYEHNAGTPYEWRESDGEPKWEIIEVAWYGDFDTPAGLARNNNSRYSVEMINRGDIAWLTPYSYKGNPALPIHAGVTLVDFIRLIQKDRGAVFMKVPENYNGMEPGLSKTPLHSKPE